MFVAVRTAPHLAEKDVVVQLREFRCKRPELVAASRLVDLFLCHDCCSVNYQCDKHCDDPYLHIAIFECVPAVSCCIKIRPRRPCPAFELLYKGRTIHAERPYPFYGYLYPNPG